MLSNQFGRVELPVVCTNVYVLPLHRQWDMTPLLLLFCDETEWYYNRTETMSSKRARTIEWASCMCNAIRDDHQYSFSRSSMVYWLKRRQKIKMLTHTHIRLHWAVINTRCDTGQLQRWQKKPQKSTIWCMSLSQSAQNERERAKYNWIEIAIEIAAKELVELVDGTYRHIQCENATQ